MSTSFPFKFVDLGTPRRFKIEPNPDFPTEMEPVCILNNLGDSSEDTFITFGTNPDPWELTFRWATAQIEGSRRAEREKLPALE